MYYAYESPVYTQGRIHLPVPSLLLLSMLPYHVVFIVKLSVFPVPCTNEPNPCSNKVSAVYPQLADCAGETFVQHWYNTVVKTVQLLYNICVHSAQKACRMHANFLKSNRRQAFINKYLPPNYLIISSYFACYLSFSIAACAAASLAIGTRNGEQLT